MNHHLQTIRHQLTDAEWDAWAGVHLHDLTYRQAAIQLGIDPSTYRKNYRRACRKLGITPIRNTP